jgi:alkanesulfonate monooxygenase SsuD/methylene tetrahydromethanopterin reductase-like flavin-dependent oxidoreductase (luciferase family)
LRPLKVGVVLDLLENVETGDRVSWENIRRSALFAEKAGFDTIWVYDELQWAPDSWPGPRGIWEGVATAGAVAEATSTVALGTWVLSALHRNPALTAKVVSTLDEISGGRLIFGFGSGHWQMQGRMYGFPSDKIVSRYEEALQIVVPLLRGETVDFDGEYHSAHLTERPRGPQGDQLPIMLAGLGERTIGLAVKYGDIWSAYARKGSQPEDFTELMGMVDDACEQAGRHPETLGRSIGVEFLARGEDPEKFNSERPLTGTAAEVAETIERFAEMGVTSLELMVVPPTAEALEQAAEVLTELG